MMAFLYNPGINELKVSSTLGLNNALKQKLQIEFLKCLTLKIFNFMLTYLSIIILIFLTVVKVRSKKLTWSPELGIRELTASPKRRIVYKKGPLDARDLRRMRLVISGKGCKCSLLIGDASWGKVNKKRKSKKRIPRGAGTPSPGSKKKRVNKKNKDKKRRKRKRYTYLIMGRKDSRGSRLLVTEIYKWTKKNKALKAAAANKFNQKACPSFNPISGY